jgi:hypothetical protein
MARQSLQTPCRLLAPEIKEPFFLEVFCRDGLQRWIAEMDCRDGLQRWIAEMDCRDGLQRWIAEMDCRDGFSGRDFRDFFQDA